MSQSVKIERMLSPFFIFFLIASTQLGIGIFNYQQKIGNTTGNDSLLVILITGISFHVLLWMLYALLKKGNGDITTINRWLLGKWMGGSVSFFFQLYFLFRAVFILNQYIATIKLWIFPLASNILISIIFLAAIYYAVSGGLRTVIGITLIGFSINIVLFFFIFVPVNFHDATNLLPIMTHPLPAILKKVAIMQTVFSGIIALFMVYPFIRNAAQSQKWAHIANLVTTIIYLLGMVAALIYFSKEQLVHTEWPTLTIWKVITFSFLERFESVANAFWFLLIVANTAVYLWCSSRIGKILFPAKQRTILIIMVLIIFIVCNFLEGFQQLRQMEQFLVKLTLPIVYVYIPCMFLLSLFKKKRGNAADETNN